MFPALSALIPATYFAGLHLFAASSLLGNIASMAVIYCIIAAYRRLAAQTSSHIRTREAGQLQAEQLAARYKAELAESQKERVKGLLLIDDRLKGLPHSKDMRTETAMARTVVQSNLQQAVESSTGVLSPEEVKRLFARHDGYFVTLCEINGRRARRTTVVDPFAPTTSTTPLPT